MAKAVKTTKHAKTREQSDDFKSVARRLECDESEERFNEALTKIARAKPGLKGGHKQ